MKEKIYTISTAHLDTSWLWTQKETVETYLPRTLKYNFEFFKKYPNYKFNFEGSYRYALIEEYYPEDFETLKHYINLGRWNICGSTVENGDSNIPSPEALIRNILYGNSYFKEKFNKKSNDIFLPDCFGFGKALPQIMSHSGLIGFSTQKLSWGSSIEPPFEFGKWKGLDGSFVYTSLKPGNYSTIFKEIRSDYTLNKIKENIRTSNVPYTMLYYGTGDRGGAPHQNAMEVLFNEIKENNKYDSEIISSSMVDFFNELKELDKSGAKLEEFDKEFLMSTHGVGSYTSRTASKRLNKRCENLLDVSEKSNSLTSILGLKEYPEIAFNFAWNRVLEHHFHDDITGTSFMECYKKNWNDYFLSLNIAKDEYLSSIALIENIFDTSNLANPIMVFNPNQDETVSTISIKMDLPYKNVKVIDLEKNEYEAFYDNGVLYFSVLVKGNTIKVFDVIESQNNTLTNSLILNGKSIENDRYIVIFDDELNISSIYDKKLNMELLSSPIRYNLIHDYDSIQWPAWEIKYSDIIRKPYAYFKDGEYKVLVNNPLIIKIQIDRVYNKSKLKTIVSLEKDSNRIDVYNELLWLEDSSNLKVSFPLSINSDHGTYDIGISKYDRLNNREKLYEVPTQKFAKIENDNIGITIITDSRQGFDKPNDNEIRLTAVHTPFSNYRYECSQHLLDFGLNIFSYSITSSFIDIDNSISEAEKFTKPMNSFKMNIHSGSIKNDLTLFSLSDNNARIMCFKKALKENKYILRVVDYYGKSIKNVNVEFIKNIKSLYSVRGDEEIIEPLTFNNNSFTFDLNNHEIKSFMIEFESIPLIEDYKYGFLPFDKVGITTNRDRMESTLKNKVSMPKELIGSDLISYKGIKYKFDLDSKYNALEFNDQIINLDRNYKYAYILLMNQGKDSNVLINNKPTFIQNSFERLGSWDLYGLKEYGYTKPISQAFAFTHYHKKDKDQILEDLYLYSVKIKIDSESIILNKNKNIALFAITYSNINNDIECSEVLIDSIKKRKFDYKLSKYELKYSKEPLNERFKDIFIDRRLTKYVDWYGGHCAQSPSDFYQIETEKKNMKRRKKLKIDEEINNG